LKKLSGSESKDALQHQSAGLEARLEGLEDVETSSKHEKIRKLKLHAFPNAEDYDQ